MERLRKLLVANRGEIAERIITTAKSLGICTVGIYSKVDAASPHVSSATEAVLLEGPDSDVYTDGRQIISIAKRTKADAIIPGYGFLSENAEFAEECVKNGLSFVGPSADAIKVFGIKHVARRLAEKAGVPIVPGTDGLVSSADDAVECASLLGYPVMLKATGGGGGLGLVICSSAEEVKVGFEKARSRGEAVYQNPGVFLERYYPASHHIEVQIFGNGDGEAIHFGERECSIQRRHQKVIEECPSPFVKRHPWAAVKLARSMNYESAGTVEFLVDDGSQDFFFLEMNTRIQVEHGITEKCYNVDLVELMLRQADARLSGPTGIPIETLLSMQVDEASGWAIEARVYAENPTRDFAPSPGVLQEVHWDKPVGSRIDTWVYTGCRVSPYYDPLLAKVIVHGCDRAQAHGTMTRLLQKSRIHGPPTNLEFLFAVVQSSEFESGNTLTAFLDDFTFTPSAIEVLRGGAYTLLQDLGRPMVGHGIPRAGAMDPVAHQVANMLVGNHSSVETLEITLNGPELLFHNDAIVALTGPDIEAQLDGKPFPMWTRQLVTKRQKLSIGALKGSGCRAYLGVYGGFLNIASYFSSKSTSPLVGIGGYQGRQLTSGDLLTITDRLPNALDGNISLPAHIIPTYQDDWNVNATLGPYSDGYVEHEGKATILNTAFTVSHNASRSGIRLIGPAPAWARADGGDGGSHPSNIMEYGYSIGALNWTGDECVILPADSPNFGGFVSTMVTIRADLWKLGQLRPGATVKFSPVPYNVALAKREAQDRYLSNIASYVAGESFNESLTLDGAAEDCYSIQAVETAPEILWSRPQEGGKPAATFRQAGDDYVLLEFGDGHFDLNNLCRVTMLEDRMKKDGANPLIDGLVNTVVGCNSLMIHFNSSKLQRANVIAYLRAQESLLGDLQAAKISCRKFKLPISYNSKAQQEATKRYMETQRPYAPYLPDSFKFVAESNAMESDDLKQMLLTQELMAFNVGFFCGATVFLPVDPRYRIACPKTNPSRVFTPEGSVSWGGSCMAIYPVDSPGGFQMLGRTIPYFDAFGVKNGFAPDRPWLYKNFDLITFYEVTDDELERLIDLYRRGSYEFSWEFVEFDMSKHNAMLKETKAEVDQLKEIRACCQDKMTEAEEESLVKWRSENRFGKPDTARLESMVADPNLKAIESPLDANVWKINIEEQELLEPEHLVCIVEAMKIEVSVRVPANLGTVRVEKICVHQGNSVKAGARLILVRKME